MLILQEYTDDFDEADEVSDEEDDEDEDDDEDDDTLDKVQLSLLSVVANLAEHDVIDSDMKLVLVRLISQRDDRIMAAYEVYQRFKDTNDLVDTLLRLAKSAGRQGIYTDRDRSTQQPAIAEIEMVDYKKSPLAADKPPSPPKPVAPKTDKILNAKDKKSVIDILANGNILSASTTRYLHYLIDQEDSTIVEIFSNYEEHQDVKRLMIDLQNIPTEDDPYEEGDDEEDGDEEEEEEEDEVDEDEEDSESIESRFMKIVKSMRLSELDTAALRLAISRNDEGVRDALEKFRIERNDSLLMQQLRAVAQKTLASTLGEAGYEVVDDDVDDEEDEDDDGEGDEYLRKLERDAADRTRQYAVDDDDDEDSDEDDVEDDDGEDEDGGYSGGGLMSKSSRNQNFPILLNGLRKEAIISDVEESTLTRLFWQGHDVVNASLDVYDLDTDMAELVDTLKKIAACSKS